MKEYYALVDKDGELVYGHRVGYRIYRTLKQAKRYNVNNDKIVKIKWEEVEDDKI